MSTLAASSINAIRLAFRTAPLVALATVVLGALSGLAAAPSAWLVKKLLDVLAAGDGSSGAVVGLAVAASLTMAASATFAYLAGIFEIDLSGRVQYVTQTRLAEACVSYEATAFLDDPEVHERLNLARRGAHEAPPVLANLVVTVVSSVALVASFATVLAASWPWMLAAVAVTSVPMAFLQRRTASRMFSAAERSAVEYRWSDYIGDLFTTPAADREMRLFDSTATLLDRHSQHLWRGVRSEVVERRRNATLQAVFTLASGAVAAAGAGIVAASVNGGNATPGDFVLFTTAVAAIQRVIVNLMNLAGTAAVAARVYGRFEEFVESATAMEFRARQVTQQAPPLRNAIEFCGVTFSYPNAAKPALQAFSATLYVGETYALVGANGSGKTTITRLLMRFYEPDSGAILWDGVDIRNYTAASIRRRISGVMQDFVRYELTVRDNVVLTEDRDADEVRLTINRALGSVDLSHAISDLPNGLETMLSPTRVDEADNRGSYLSGGQWQRLAIARALGKASIDVLVLDEPDAALDVAGAEMLQRIAADSGIAKITILITHRSAPTHRVDHVVRLKGGRMLEDQSP